VPYLISGLSLDLEWDRPLSHRRGSAHRLDGIDVYYDLVWDEHFSDGRAQFKNGRSLARRVRQECPDGKTPALLLTDREDVDERFLQTPLHGVFVLNLPRYRSTAADASLSYFAHRLGPGIADIGPLDEYAAARANAGAAVLAAELSLSQIAEWAEDNPERQQQLRAIAGAARPDEPADASVVNVLAAVQALRENLDPEAVSAIARIFGPEVDDERRVQLLRAVTEDLAGRSAVREVLAERMPERLADARAAVAAYDALLEDPHANETDMQKFIEEHLWLLGLDYVAMRPRQTVVIGAIDFLLERFDGFHDLLELKNPQDPIVTIRGSHDGSAAPPPSSYALSADLAQALAQVHVYRDRLTSHADAHEALLGLSHTREPRMLVVIGRVSPMSGHARRVLAELNRSLHRVEVVPYDLIAKRAGAVLDSIERYRLFACDSPSVADVPLALAPQ
jgi:hypothetical protein